MGSDLSYQPEGAYKDTRGLLARISVGCPDHQTITLNKKRAFQLASIAAALGGRLPLLQHWQSSSR